MLCLILNNYGSKKGNSTIVNPSPPWFNRPAPLAISSHIAIIGGGIAGVSMALHLKKQGYKVTLIEKKQRLMSGASGNPGAILEPFLGLGKSIEKEFYRTAYLYALEFYKKMGRGVFKNCGLVKTAQDKQEITRFKKISDQYCEDILTFKNDTLFLPQSGIVKPDKMIDLIDESFQVILNTTVDEIKYNAPFWSLFDQDKKTILTCDALIVCNSYNILKFEQTNPLSLDQVSGQISYIKNHLDLKNILSGSGYLTPAIKTDVGMVHICGATFDKNDVIAVTKEAHLENLQKSPIDIDNNMIVGGRRKIRAMSPDHLPIVGPAPIFHRYMSDYQQIHHGIGHKKFPNAAYYENLFICTALGARGFVTAPLLAKYLSAVITGNEPDLDQRTSNALHPGRFIIRKLSKK